MSQPTQTQTTTLPIAPLDPNAIVTNGYSPTAIILAIAILIAALLGSITTLVKILVDHDLKSE